MRIGMIGSGKIGGTLGAALVRAGHQVVLANSRGPQSLTALVDQLGGRARAATVGETARDSEVVVLAIPFAACLDLPARLLADKVVLDATNYVPERDGAIPDLETAATTSSELLSRRLAGARVVKAVNSIFWEHLRDDARPAGSPDRLALPVAGDDQDAKNSVRGLLDQVGFDSVDAGPLTEGRRFQRGTPPYVQRLTTAQLREALRWADHAAPASGP